MRRAAEARRGPSAVRQLCEPSDGPVLSGAERVPPRSETPRFLEPFEAVLMAREPMPAEALVSIVAPGELTGSPKR